MGRGEESITNRSSARVENMLRAQFVIRDPRLLTFYVTQPASNCVIVLQKQLLLADKLAKSQP